MELPANSTNRTQWIAAPVMNHPPHRRWLWLCCAVWCLVAPAAAQPGALAIEWAGQADPSTITVQVRLPRGQILESASLVFDDVAVPLGVSPDPLPVTQWVLLDASGGMLNFQSTVQTSLQRWLGSDATLQAAQIGLLAYNEELTQIAPSRIQSRLEAFLADYTATANTAGCLWDALAALDEADDRAERAVRVLVITADWTRQTPCTQTAPPDRLTAPIEIIVLANEADDALIELAQRGGTAPLFANVRLLDARLSEIGARWDDPTYRLDGALPAGMPLPTTAQLAIVLADGTQWEQVVRFDTFVPAPLPTVPPTLTATTRTTLSATPTRTDTPTAPPTLTRPPTQTAPPATAVPITPETTAADVPPEPPPTATPETTAAADVLPMDALSTALDQQPDATAGPPPPADSASLMSDENLPVLVLLGGTLLVVGAGLVLLAVARLRRKPSPAEAPKDDSDSFYDTLDKQTDSLRTPVVPVMPAQPQEAAGGVVGELDQLMTRMEEVELLEEAAADPAEQTGFVELDTDLLAQMKTISDPQNASNGGNDPQTLITRVLTDAQFRAMMDQSQDTAVVAWLQVVSPNMRQTVELTQRGAIVGRSRDCDVQITGDSAISRQHARFDVPQAGRVTISRMSATNPVVVAGIQVSNRHLLQPNDVVYLSDQTYIVFILNEEDGDEASSQDDDDDRTRT